MLPDNPTADPTRIVRHSSNRANSRLWLCLLILLLSACKMDGRQEPATSVIRVDLLVQGSFCQAGSTEPSMALIGDDDAYRSAYQQIRKHIPDSAAIPPTVDFDRFDVLAVYMGSRSTAGYRVGLASGAANVGENNELYLQVSWTEPPEGVLLAQVMTSPCMLVSIQKGAYSAIHAIDEKGSIRITGSLDRE